MKSITTVERHMSAIIATIVFDQKDCYTTVSATC